MASDAPILEAEAVFADAIRDALASLVGTFNSKPKVYYQLAEQGCPLPYVVFQFQSDIGRMDWIGRTDATALLTLKALASSPKGARDLLATAAPGMTNISATGYTLSARYVRSPTMAPVAGVAQAMHIYRLRIEDT